MPRQPRPPQSQKWCFTINNYTPESLALLTGTKSQIIGKEVGKEVTPHLQGYAVFESAKRFTQVQKMLPGAHLEIAKGSHAQNIAYCSKEDNYVEVGDRPIDGHIKGGQANKERYERNWEIAKTGKFQDCDKDLLWKHYRTAKQIATDFMPKLDDLPETCGIWYYGESGAGKSYRARQECPDAYLKLCNKWWDGYQNEDDVIIDDWDKTHACLGHHLKIWADCYQFNAETKGGMLRIRPKKIIVTSQYAIEDIWEDDETCQALCRRYKQIKVKRDFN